MQNKFRAKEKKTGKWVYGEMFGGLLYTHPTTGTHHNGFEFGKEVIEETIGRYVNRKDKDGQELYEDDVFIIDDKIHGVIRYNDSHMGFCISDPKLMNFYDENTTYQMLNQYWWNKYTIKVIGNIHDNKNLLK